MEKQLVVLTAHNGSLSFNRPPMFAVVGEKEVMYYGFANEVKGSKTEAYLSGVVWLLNSGKSFYVACDNQKLVKAMNENPELYPNLTVYYIDRNHYSSTFSSIITMADTFFEKIVAEYDENTQVREIIFATDASKSIGGDESSWAWVCSTGEVNFGRMASENVNNAELRAIVEAVKFFRDNYGDGKGSNKCVVYTDSKVAKNIVAKAKSVDNLLVSSKLNASPELRVVIRDVNKLVNSVDFALKFQKGHTDSKKMSAVLNDYADRIAKVYRRAPNPSAALNIIESIKKELSVTVAKSY